MFRVRFTNNCFTHEATSLEPQTGFRYFEMGKNCMYELNDSHYFHFLFILEGEIMMGGLKRNKPIAKKNDFVHIPDVKTTLLANKKSKFVLFSINDYYCRIEPIFYKEMSSILTGLHKQAIPLQAPLSLSIFYNELIILWGNKLDDLIIQEIKAKELVIILKHLFAERIAYNYDLYAHWPYGKLSLS